MKKIMLGNEAIARGAFEAGCRVATAYPGTPSTEILESISAVFPDIKAQWSCNEKVAFEVAAGAAIAGARSLAAMKHVGLNVAADPLFTFSYSGINAGLVIVNADDPGPWSSQNEQDNRHYARSAKLPMLEPSDPEEARLFTKAAFGLSEEFDRPFIIRTTTRLSHSRGAVEMGDKLDIPLREYRIQPEKYVMIPMHARPRHKFIEEQLLKLRAYAETSPFNRVEKGNSSRGIICSGVAYQYVREACPDDNILKLGIAWPLPDELIRSFASSVQELFVVEELDPFIEDYVKALGIKAVGKDLIPLCGEIDADIVDRELNGNTHSNNLHPYKNRIPGRPPSLCKGCPHAYIFKTLRKLGLIVAGDIGCYTLAALPPYNAMHSQLCMGAGIGMHLGFEKAWGDKLARNSVSVIGDSTFIHSGITGLIDMVYNKGTGTVLILDNRTTGMTGHQENPATGKTLSGEVTHQLDIEAVVKAVGVRRVFTIDPLKIDEFEILLKAEVLLPELSVIIAKRKCILKK